MTLFRNIVLSLLFLCSVNASAQTVADLWVSMPQDLVPYVSVNARKEMIECLNIGVDTSVKNTFSGSTDLDTLTTEYGRFVLSKVKDVQIIRLPYEGGDSIVCLIETYHSPEAQSKIAFYDLKWNKLSNEDKFPQNLKADDFFSKPDTMTMEKFEELKKLISLELFEFRYDADTKELAISFSTPLTTKEEKEKLKVVIPERKLKWIGKTFN